MTNILHSRPAVYKDYFLNYSIYVGISFYVWQLTALYQLPTGWAKINGANAVSFVVVKHVLENFDNFWQLK